MLSWYTPAVTTWCVIAYVLCKSSASFVQVFCKGKVNNPTSISKQAGEKEAELVHSCSHYMVCNCLRYGNDCRALMKSNARNGSYI